jgi:membrane protein DedA with SNARE-associated domain
MGSFITNHIQSAGYAALILFGFLEACCIPISSEVTFGFAGVLAYQGHMNLALVIVVGSLAELAGSYTSYFIGRAGGRPLVRKVGRFILVTESDVDRAERFLDGRGAWAIPVGRMIPFVRAIVSIVAGLVRVPPVRFGVLSAIGTVLYAVILSSIGYGVGSAWNSVSHGLSNASYAIVAVVVIVLVAAYLFRLRQYRREQAARAASSSESRGPAAPGQAAPGPAAPGQPNRPGGGGKHSKSAGSSTNAEVG